MKKMWARIGVEINLTDEEYEKFIKYANGDASERETSESLFLQFLKNKEKTHLNGESYFPDEIYCEGYDNPEYEINFDF